MFVSTVLSQIVYCMSHVGRYLLLSNVGISTHSVSYGGANYREATSTRGTNRFPYRMVKLEWDPDFPDFGSLCRVLDARSPSTTGYTSPAHATGVCPWLLLWWNIQLKKNQKNPIFILEFYREFHFKLCCFCMKDNLANFLIAFHSYGLETMLPHLQGMCVAGTHRGGFSRLGCRWF